MWLTSYKPVWGWFSEDSSNSGKAFSKNIPGIVLADQIQARGPLDVGDTILDLPNEPTLVWYHSVTSPCIQLGITSNRFDTVLSRASGIWDQAHLSFGAV